MFRYAEERGHVRQSPARGVKLLKSDSIVHDRFLTYEEYITLLVNARRERQVVRSTLFNHRWKWIVLACNTGLRPGEQRVLEFSNIYLTHGFLRVQSKPQIGFHVKNYQHRYIPLAPATRKAVEAQRAKKHPDSDLGFHRRDGSPWGDIGNCIDDLVVNAGLQRDNPTQRLTPHSFRHTFASWLAIAGASLRRTQELLGHKASLPRSGIRTSARTASTATMPTSLRAWLKTLY